MSTKHERSRTRLLIAVASLLPTFAWAQDASSVEERLRRLEQRQAELEREIAEKDRRIAVLEGRSVPPAQTAASGTSQPAAPPIEIARGEEQHEHFGVYVPRGGFTLVDADNGNLRMKLLTYVRYLNQTALDDTFTDSFGTTTTVDLRQDTQLNKVSIQFLGWLLDPKFRFLAYAWTSNPTQGLGAQVVLGGYLSYAFNEHFTLAGGVNALPGVRSTEGSFPLWLTVDNRLIADEFFRPSFTQGFWARGNITDKLAYYVQIGNNLSTLGVDAAQLDNDFDTWSASLAWLPTTGEFGSHQSGYGDYDWHEQLATRFGIHYTQSGEDAQQAPNTDLFENVTIRLSDGNSIFKANLFGPGITIEHAKYRMASAEAAAKYHGFSLEGEYYHRWVDDFRGSGTAAVPDLRDHGFQLQASAMLIPKYLQAYVGASKIFGEFGDPWDARVGVNLYPFRNQVVRWNTEVLYLDRSPVGGLSLPYVVGGNGYVFYSSLLLDL